MSTVLCWLRLTEYVPSILVEKRASRMLPLHDRLERTVRCGRNAGETRYTFGAVVEKTVPVVPSVHVLGIDDEFDAYAAHCGTGAASPTHMICCEPVGKPVLSSAAPI